METFFFAVPYRLIWDNWQKFNGEQEAPGDSTDFTIPTVDAPPTVGWTVNDIGDHFGIPTGVADLTTSSLPFRAYNLIFDQWFRDQNLVQPPVKNTDDGPDNHNNYFIQKRGKRHDYFTSSLPFPQKGDSITVPLGTQAPITGLGITNYAASNQDLANIHETDGSPGTTTYAWSKVFDGTENQQMEITAATGAYPMIYADLTNATEVAINTLRQGFQIQKMLERDARGGSRYTEIIRSHFGVTSPDARLQRPEYLGGGSSPVIISPVAQTSETDLNSPQGNLAAFGTATLHSHGFTKSFTEHCIIIGIINVRADLTYQQGLNRQWSRQTRFDFYWPALSHIGEQTVLNKEIFADGSAADELIFGYQERFAEYRYFPSQITGLFRSQAPTSLDSWHLSQDFATLPVLNDEFIEEEVPMDRVLAVPSEPDFIFDSYFSMRCARPMPLYGVPGLIDHF